MAGVSAEGSDSAAPPRAPRRRWSRRLAFRLCGALGLPLLLFACGELYVRQTRMHEDLWVMTGRAPAPHLMAEWAQPDAFSAYRARIGRYGPPGSGKTVSPQGFISTPPLEKTKPAGRRRIVFLGGSSTAGSVPLIADEKTWPWRALEGLRAARPELDLDFVNAALPGYSTFESLGRLTHRLRFYRPDVIVVYHGWNDLYYFTAERVEEIERWRTLPDGSWGFPPGERHSAIAPSWVDHLIWPSQLLTKGRRVLAGGARAPAGEASAARELRAEFDRRGLEVWRENLRLLQATAQTLGAELLVCKQATLIVAELPEAERARCRYEFHGFGHDAHVAAFRELYAVIDELFPPARVIDLTSLSGRSELFEDHIHPTEQGCEQLGRLVSEALTGALE